MGHTGSTSVEIGLKPLAPISVGVGPLGHMALLPNGLKAYVASGGLAVIDTNPASANFNTVLTTIPVGTSPYGVAVTPDGSRVYATNQGTRAVVNWQGGIAHGVDVIDIDPASPTCNTLLAPPFPVVSGEFGDVAVAADSRFAYGTDAENLLFRFNLQTSAIDARGPGAAQSAFALTPDGTALLEGNPNTNDLRIVKASVLTLIANVPMGAPLAFVGGIAITPDGTRAYVKRDTLSANSHIVMVPLQ